jgi:hypothetical protein
MIFFNALCFAAFVYFIVACQVYFGFPPFYRRLEMPVLFGKFKNSEAAEREINESFLLCSI